MTGTVQFSPDGVFPFPDPGRGLDRAIPGLLVTHSLDCHQLFILPVFLLNLGQKQIVVFGLVHVIQVLELLLQAQAMDVASCPG